MHLEITKSQLLNDIICIFLILDQCPNMILE